MANILIPNSLEKLTAYLTTYEEGIRYGAYDIDIYLIPIKKIRRQDLEIIAKYAQSSQLHLARNADTPSYIFEIILDKNDNEVKRVMAQNPSTPPNILRRLSTDVDDQTRINVAENPRTPQEIIRLLMKDSSPEVKQIATKHPKRPKLIDFSIFIEEDFDYKLSKASRTSAPILDLEQYADDPNPYIREAVASNPATPRYLLKKLMQDKNEDVRRAVLNNPNKTLKMIQHLTNDKNEKNKRLALEQQSKHVGFWKWVEKLF